MIDEADDRVLAWARNILGHDQVSLGLPASADNQDEVRLHLLEISLEPTRQTTKHTRLTLLLKYLVTARSATAVTAHRMLSELLVAAVHNPEFQIDRTPLPVSVWHALGVPPQAAFQFRTQACKDFPVTPAKMVRRVMLETVQVGALHGSVLGPEEIPLADSTVELPQISMSTRTDGHGRFAFSMVPDKGITTLLVRAKGREQSFDISANPPDAPLTIRFEMEE
jgi:hypothetical protein